MTLHRGVSQEEGSVEGTPMAVGIDLGTSNSCISAVIDGKTLTAAWTLLWTDIYLRFS